MNRNSIDRPTIAIAPAEQPATTAPRALAARIAAPSGDPCITRTRWPGWPPER